MPAASGVPSLVRAVPQPLPGAFRRRLQALDSEKIAKIVAEAVEPEPSSAAGATSGGDREASQRAAAIGRGVRGAIAGTVPGERLE